MRTTNIFPAYSLLIIASVAVLTIFSSCSRYSQMATRWHYRHEYRHTKVTHLDQENHNITKVEKAKA